MKSSLMLAGTLLLLQAGFVSCDKNDDNQAPAGGTLAGTVQVWNDKTTSLSDRSGVLVTILNLSGKTATTAADGSFKFDNLPFDNYDLSFSKAGYGTRKVFGVSHASSGSTNQIPTVQFGAVSTTAITTHTFVNTTFNNGPGVSYTLSFSPTPTSASRAYHRAFLGTSNAVSNTNYTAYSQLRSALSNNATGGFTADELYAMGFTPGQTVFIKVYGDSFQSNDYDDPATGRTVFPNLNTTSPAPISFIVP